MLVINVLRFIYLPQTSGHWAEMFLVLPVSRVLFVDLRCLSTIEHTKHYVTEYVFTFMKHNQQFLSLSLVQNERNLSFQPEMYLT